MDTLGRDVHPAAVRKQRLQHFSDRFIPCLSHKVVHCEWSESSCSFTSVSRIIEGETSQRILNTNDDGYSPEKNSHVTIGRGEPPTVRRRKSAEKERVREKVTKKAIATPLKPRRICKTRKEAQKKRKQMSPPNTSRADAPNMSRKRMRQSESELPSTRTHTQKKGKFPWEHTEKHIASGRGSYPSDTRHRQEGAGCCCAAEAMFSPHSNCDTQRFCWHKPVSQCVSLTFQVSRRGFKAEEQYDVGDTLEVKV